MVPPSVFTIHTTFKPEFDSEKSLITGTVEVTPLQQLNQLREYATSAARTMEIKGEQLCILVDRQTDTLGRSYSLKPNTSHTFSTAIEHAIIILNNDIQKSGTEHISTCFKTDRISGREAMQEYQRLHSLTPLLSPHTLTKYVSMLKTKYPLS
jgi:hypothetical protein